MGGKKFPLKRREDTKTQKKRERRRDARTAEFGRGKKMGKGRRFLTDRIGEA